MSLSKSDKYGSYTMEIQGRILSIILKGAMGTGLSKHYARDLVKTSEQLAGAPWGYFACAREFDASTLEASDIAAQAYKYCMENGCIVDTYCLSSPVAKNQLQQIRSSLNINPPLEERLFDNKQQAFDFIHKILAKSHVA